MARRCKPTQEEKDKHWKDLAREHWHLSQLRHPTKRQQKRERELYESLLWHQNRQAAKLAEGAA